MSIHQWPIQERPREKLIAGGAENISDAELLAIILSTGTRDKTALDLARDLINHYGDLRKLFNADMRSFTQLPGLGAAKFCQLQAALELGKRCLQESFRRHGNIKQVKDVKNFLMTKLRDLEHEVFICLFLDSKNQLIAYEKLFHGSINSANVHPREVVKRALHHNAAAIIVAHNHPSGIAEASQADRDITTQLAQALRLVEVRLLDHFIVGNPEVISFTECGLL